MLWLDHLLFGNGNGIKSPYFDNIFYCLSGRLYTYSFGYGAQLHSTQWFHPIAGEKRVLAGETFVVFNSTRRWLRVQVAWSLVRLPEDITNAANAIRKFKAKLDNL